MTAHRSSLLAIVVALAAAAACGPVNAWDGSAGQATPAALAVSASGAPGARVKAPITPREPWLPPTSESLELTGTSKLFVLRREGEPVVELRFVFDAGSERDGERLGLSLVSGQIVERSMTEALQPLGASVSVDVQPGASALRVRVLGDDADRALSAVGRALRAIKITPDALVAARASAIGRPARALRAEPDELVRQVAAHELFVRTLSRHPLAPAFPERVDLDAVDLQSARAFIAERYARGVTAVVAVGTIDAEAFAAQARRDLGGAPTAAAVPIAEDLPAETRAGRNRIVVIDDPGRKDALALVGHLAPVGVDDTSVVLVSADLAASATERTGSAVDSDVWRASADERAIFIRARGPSQDVGTVVQRILEAHEVAARTPDPDADRAIRFWSDRLRLRASAQQTVAEDLTALLGAGLGSDHEARTARALSAALPGDITRTCRSMLDGDRAIVVLGDAGVVGPMLARWGDVDVLDPRAGLSRVRAIARDRPGPVVVP